MKAMTILVILYFILIYRVECNCPENLLEQTPPQFQIIAAAKTGSTSLYSYLCKHPEIQCFAKRKELNLLRQAHMKVGTEKVSTIISR